MDELGVIQETPKGEGLLFVDAAIWDDLGKPETPEAWHKAALLPESYEITHIGLPTLHDDRYTLHVRHEAIPVVVGAAYLPTIVLHHEINYQGEHKQISLLKVEIMRWNGARWERAAITDRRVVHEIRHLLQQDDASTS